MKERMMEVMESAIDKNCSFYIKVQMPGCLGLETIINPPENLRFKAKYYDQCYGNDLHMHKVPGLRIVEFGHLETNMK